MTEVNVYSMDMKRKLADRIHELKNLDHFKKIKTIILQENQDLEFTKNGNGLFAYFQSLNNETYVKIEKFLDKVDKQKQRESEASSASEQASEPANIQTQSHKEVSKKLRLTNTETHLINRVKYEKELEKNAISLSEPYGDTYYDPISSIENSVIKSSKAKPKKEKTIKKERNV